MLRGLEVKERLRQALDKLSIGINQWMKAGLIKNFDRGSKI